MAFVIADFISNRKNAIIITKREDCIMIKRFVVAFALAAGFCFSAVFANDVKEKQNIVFIGAHPDDSEGFAGLAFLLSEKYNIHIVDYTNGDFGLGMPGFLDGSTARIRIQEEKNACALMGATPHFIGAVDANAYVTSNDVAKIAKLLSDLKPVAVFTHWPVDSHPDHVMTAAATYKAIRLIKCRAEFYYYEVLEGQTRAWTPLFSVDISSVMDKKIEMLRRYKCQNENDELVKAKVRLALKRGNEREIKVKYAETFTTYNGKPPRKDRPCIFSDLKESILVK
jgi:LmbE family N-acetylglucosaminyl deacetylase